MGLSAIKPKGVLRYNQYDQAIRAALEGQGIALGRIALIEPLLSKGRLVAVGGADSDHAQGYAYWLVQADPTPRDDVNVVIDWIRAEAHGVEARLEDEPKRVLSALEPASERPEAGLSEGRRISRRPSVRLRALSLGGAALRRAFIIAGGGRDGVRGGGERSGGRLGDGAVAPDGPTEKRHEPVADRRDRGRGRRSGQQDAPPRAAPPG